MEDTLNEVSKTLAELVVTVRQLQEGQKKLEQDFKNFNSVLSALPNC